MAEVNNIDVKTIAIKIWEILHEHKVPLGAIPDMFKAVTDYITAIPVPTAPKIKEQPAPKEQIKPDNHTDKIKQDESEFQKEWAKMREAALKAREGR